jgi:hypothetical protein
MSFKHKSSDFLGSGAASCQIIVAVLAKQQCVAYPTGKLRLMTAFNGAAGSLWFRA